VSALLDSNCIVNNLKDSSALYGKKAHMYRRQEIGMSATSITLDESSTTARLAGTADGMNTLFSRKYAEVLDDNICAATFLGNRLNFYYKAHPQNYTVVRLDKLQQHFTLSII
jgi:hypothetical protein